MITAKFNFSLIFSMMFFLHMLCMSCDKYKNIQEPRNETALYVLPFPVGVTYTCTQSFDGHISHYGVFKYAVDFAMPIGTIITVARRGRVVFVEEHFEDRYTGSETDNVVVIIHEDSTYARYAHIKRNGVLVEVDQEVSEGDTIALSGCSGTIAPHLHFDVTQDCPYRDCQTIPFSFRNCNPPHDPLVRGTAYTAEPY